MTPETRLSNDIKLWCGEHNILCFHINQGTLYTQYGGVVKLDTPNGFPDLLCIYTNSRTAFIETKIKPRKPTKDQLRVQALLRDRGFPSTTVYTLQEFIDYIKKEWNIND